nr:MAG TPA: hypothetical protein [Caudoviricetes sp.]
MYPFNCSFVLVKNFILKRTLELLIYQKYNSTYRLCQ